MVGMWSIDRPFGIQRVPDEQREFARRKQVEAFKTLLMSLAGGSVITVACLVFDVV